MELEAENWWLDGTWYDFDDKNKSSKNIIIFIENQYKHFQKSRKISIFSGKKSEPFSMKKNSIRTK